MSHVAQASSTQPVNPFVTVGEDGNFVRVSLEGNLTIQEIYNRVIPDWQKDAPSLQKVVYNLSIAKVMVEGTTKKANFRFKNKGGFPFLEKDFIALQQERNRLLEEIYKLEKWRASFNYFGETFLNAYKCMCNKESPSSETEKMTEELFEVHITSSVLNEQFEVGITSLKLSYCVLMGTLDVNKGEPMSMLQAGGVSSYKFPTVPAPFEFPPSTLTLSDGLPPVESITPDGLPENPSSTDRAGGVSDEAFHNSDSE